MAETPSNGHAPDGPLPDLNGNPPPPVMPLVRAPEGARAQRTFDGAPIQIEEVEEATALDETPEIEDAADYRADLHDSFDNGEAEAEAKAEAEAEAAIPDLSGIESAPPLGVSLEKDDDPTNGFAAYAPEAFREENDDPDPYRNHNLEAAGIETERSIEGEQLFADDGAGGDPPSENIALATSGGDGRPDTPKDKEQGLFEHLNELRARLLHAMLGVIAVMFFTWGYTYKLQDWFATPIKSVLTQNGIKKGDLVLLGAPEAFTLYFQFSLTSALIIAMPWVLFQAWRFVEPALTNSERRYTLVLVPFSSVLFFMGAGLGYLCAPLFFKFFLEYQPPGVLAQWKYDESIILMAKMLLIFGLAFQVPIIIIFGHKIGLISRNLLIEYWRHAVVVIFIVVAVLTPTWDPVTMTACALPPCLLYLLSIWLVKWL